MAKPDLVEFYEGEGNTPFLTVESSMPPSVGVAVNIRKVSYRVTRLDWCVDHADKVFDAQMRCAVTLVRGYA